MDKYTREKNYNELQIGELAAGISRGLDTSLFDDPRFTWEQMREIRLGQESGIDVTSYAKLQYSSIEMRIRREKLENEHFNSLFSKIEDLRSLGFDMLQRVEIYKALKDGKDVSSLLDPNLSFEEIRKRRLKLY